MTPAQLVLDRMTSSPADWSWNCHTLVQDPDAFRQSRKTMCHWGEMYPDGAEPVLPADQMDNIDALMADLVESGSVVKGMWGWKIATGVTS